MSTVATLFAGPGSAANVSGSVNENVGFRFVLDRTVQVLSTNGLEESHKISGLLFVPGLATEDPCNEILAEIIPKNVTRYEDVSNFGYPVVGIAPWVSEMCTQSFLTASRESDAEALIFFNPYNNQSGIPPPATDVSWNLNDGDHWKEINQYPVYAISGPAAATLMHELAWFSDGKTNRSQGENYSTVQKRDSSVRLFTMITNEIQTESNSNLWVFAVVIVPVFICMGLIGFCFWRRLGPLRALAVQGDIEGLSLGQMTPAQVPREVVDRLPLYTYAGPPSVTSLVKDEIEIDVAEVKPSSQFPEPLAEKANSEDAEKPMRDTQRVVGIRRPAPAVINPRSEMSEMNSAPTHPWRLSGSQSKCAICTEDFVIGSSRIRELPCGHVFDCECIDEWLLTKRGECPLCRASVLLSFSANSLVSESD